VRSPRQPSVWIISGPSGVGKGTVCAKLRELRPGIHIPVSLTTRQPRPGEIDGISYHFVPEHRFREMAASGQLLEHAVVHGRYSYGTPRKDVADAIAAGRDVLLEIDIQGARQVKRNLPEAKLVFIAPPSWETPRLRPRTPLTCSDSAHARSSRSRWRSSPSSSSSAR